MICHEPAGWVADHSAGNQYWLNRLKCTLLWILTQASISRADVGPTLGKRSAPCQPYNIGPTSICPSAQCSQRRTNVRPTLNWYWDDIVPTFGQCWGNVGPTFVYQQFANILIIFFTNVLATFGCWYSHIQDNMMWLGRHWHYNVDLTSICWVAQYWANIRPMLGQHLPNLFLSTFWPTIYQPLVADIFM